MEAAESSRNSTPSSSASKKVRFDLKHEVFVIPSKWDHLSSKIRPSIARERLINELSNRPKTRALEERKSSRSKQNGRGRKQIKHYGKTHRKRKTVTARTLNAEHREKKEIPELRFTQNNIPDSFRGVNLAVLNGKLATSLTVSKTEQLQTTPAIKLKMTHRSTNDLGQKVNIVLPKITYTPGLRKAIEKALIRSRGHYHESHLSPEHKDFQLKNFSASVDRGNYTARKLSLGNRNRTEEKTLSGTDTTDDGKLEHGQRTVNKLSENLDEWTPFPPWNEMAQTNQSNRKEKGFSIIPDSILY